MNFLSELANNPYVAAAGILLGGLVSAYVVAWILTGIVGRLVGKTETDADDRALQVLRTPIIVSTLLVAVHFAANRHDLMSERALYYLGAALKTLGAIVWGRAVHALFNILLDVLSRRKGKSRVVQPRTLPVFEIFNSVIVGGMVVYFIFLAWRIDLTAWLASAGIVGIAVGFAAKDTLANLFSGIFIVADAPYQVGDMVVIDGTLRGQVLSIGLRSTRLLTIDDVAITVPNAVIGNGLIVNETGGPSPSQRIAVTVEAAYGSDIDLVHETLLQVPKTVDDLDQKHAPEIVFRDFGASGLVHTLHVWVSDPHKKEPVTHALRTGIYKAFAEAAIEIPYSKHDVYIKEAPEPLRRVG